jgi:hypothetical protein
MTMSARGVALAAGGPTARSRAATAGHPRLQSTPAQLRRLVIGLLGMSVLLGVTAALLLAGLRSTSDSVSGTASPAYLDAIQARAALSDADRAAWQSFRSGEAQFIGPGQQYQNDITTAGQALERLAALQAPGSADSSLLQTISGQLVNYQGLVERADDAYQRDVALGEPGKHDLGFAYLAYASNAMRDPGGLLASIGQLAGPDQQALAGQMASPWANPALLLIFVVPVLLLIACIGFAHSVLRRRFNRMLSPPLLVAAALVITMFAWLAVATLHADSAFAAARGTALPRVTSLWQAQTNAVSAEAEQLQSGNTAPVTDRESGGLNAAATAQADSALGSDLASAQDIGGWPAVIPLLAIALAALCYLGLRPRLGEYRGIGGRY